MELVDFYSWKLWSSWNRFPNEYEKVFLECSANFTYVVFRLPSSCDGTSRDLCSLSVSLLLLCTCALVWFSLSSLSRSFITHHLIKIIILILVGHYTFLILSLLITLTLLLPDYYYQSPIYSLLPTCLVLIVFFLLIILFNTFVGLIDPSFSILSFHHSPTYRGTWDSI